MIFWQGGNKVLNYRPDEVIVEIGSEESLIARNLRRALPDVPFTLVDHPKSYLSALQASRDPFGKGKRRLLLMRHKGDFLKKCPGSDGQVCCNYFVINFASNCPMECSYCYLQDYLAQNPALKVFSNVGDLLEEAHKLLSRHRRFFFRIGTGEITDSLALDPYIGISEEIVPFFAEQPNALLELKTKSDCVDGLLTLDPKDRVVVSWSLNPPEIIEAEEHGTAPLADRLRAAQRVQAAGYKLGFHFDPLIEYPGWEEGYRDLISRLFSAVDARRIAWISLGSLRLTPSMRSIIRRRFADTRVLSGEQVACADGKWRTFQALRVRMYRRITNWIAQCAPRVPCYMCMETPAVWEKVFGRAPGCDRDVARGLIGRSLG